MCTLSLACSGTEAPGVERAPEAEERFFASLTQLTFEGQNAEAYFSPDGERLIFQRQDSANACDQQFVVNIDGSGLSRVSNGLGRTTCGYFFDGGSRILYSSTFHRDEACPAEPDRSRGYVWGLHDFDIYTSLPDGSELTRLTETEGYTAEATLSPDGQSIVFTSVMDGDLEIYTMNVDGSGLRRLTNTPGYDGGPFFSPDGRQICWRRFSEDGATAEIMVMNADGSDKRQLTKMGAMSWAPFYHPSGEYMIT